MVELRKGQSANTERKLIKKTRPSASLTLEEEELRFYAAIGKALAQWQQVESELARVYTRAIAHPHLGGLSNITFYSVFGFRDKRNITHNVLVGQIRAFTCSKGSHP